MNVSVCLQKIEKYLTKIDTGVFVVDVQNSADLFAIQAHFNVGGNVFISASDYSNIDELPRIDTLLDVLARKDENIFLMGLSSFLKFHGEEKLHSELSNLLAMTISGHVVILTYQCKRYLKFSDPRPLPAGRICIVDGSEDSLPNLVFASSKLPLPNDGITVNGINEIADALEKKSADTVYVKTSKQKKTFPYSLYCISDLRKAFEVLILKDTSTAALKESFGTEVQWSYALEKFNTKKNWAEVITAEFGNCATLDLVMPSYSGFDSDRKWLFFIALKLYGAKNNWCLDTATARADSFMDLTKELYRCILDVETTNTNFPQYYFARKTLLNALGNPLDDVVDFCKIVKSKEQRAIYYLTDNTQQEKELIILLLDQYGLQYTREDLENILKMVYPNLYAYLSPFRFKNALLDDYFQIYKYEKVINKVLPEFEAIVNEQAGKRDYNKFLEPRVSKIEAIAKNSSQLYFIDAMGVEYLGFIMSLCRAKGLVVNVTVCRCELPSITSRNKEFIDSFSTTGLPVVSIKEIDDIKHHGKDNYDYQQTKLPIHLVRELEIIEEVIDKIRVKLASGVFEKAVLISDHGSSRLAVIHETENMWEMASKGEHSGRCCLKTEVDVQPEYATDANDFWSLANYDRFKGGRKANVEVHGGATLEEVTVPIIEITYSARPIEVRLMPIDAEPTFTGTPEIEVSYRKKATIKLFLTKKMENVSICIDGKYYDAISSVENFYIVEMADIKSAKQYFVDVYASDNMLASNLPLIVKKEGAEVKDLL